MLLHAETNHQAPYALRPNHLNLPRLTTSETINQSIFILTCLFLNR
jgi:hypothetical protein